jgi:hypothetical protein
MTALIPSDAKCLLVVNSAAFAYYGAWFDAAGAAVAEAFGLSGVTLADLQFMFTPQRRSTPYERPRGGSLSFNA